MVLPAASRPSAGKVPAVTVGGHFERVAAVYESLRTTDEAPVRAIGQLLPDRPVTGVDTGCGTGRYSRLLRALLPEGSRLVVSDVSAAMLAQLKPGNHGHAREVVPLLAAAEELPLRTASLDLVTAFNCVHHFDLGRFLTAAARVTSTSWSWPVASRRNQGEPDGLARRAARRSRIRPSRSALPADEAPSRLPDGRADHPVRSPWRKSDRRSACRP